MKLVSLCSVWVVSLTMLSGLALGQDYRSPCALVSDPDGLSLYIAEHTGQRIVIWDLQTSKISRSISLPQRPNGLVLTPDGQNLIVTVGGADGQLMVLDAASGQVQASVTTGHTPMSPVVSEDGQQVSLCCRFSGTVETYTLNTLQRIQSVAVDREPVALVAIPNHTDLLVANHLPDQPADMDYVAATLRRMPLHRGGRRLPAPVLITLPNGSTGVRGLCCSPDGRYAYVTHILARYQLPTTQVDRGWMNTNALSIIDLSTSQWLNTILLDNVDRGAANPWAVTCTADGKQLVVTHAGSQELSVIDRQALHDKLNKTDAPDSVPNDLAFVYAIRRLVPLGGNGPRAVVTVENRAFVTEYFTDSLGIVDLDSKAGADSIALGSPQILTQERLGEMYFNDASLCFQKWQSCSTCHPDSRADALNWDLLNDGMGNAKNTRSLLRSHETAPVMITGIRPNAETAVRAGIRFIQFVVRPDEDAQAIDAYLRSMTPVPSPYLVDGQLSETALRGQQLFESSGCALCHNGRNMTNQKQYDVGTGTDREAGREFDTPTLVEVWRTAPYLYDGRAHTMREVLREFNAEDQHGMTSHLSDAELTDLAEYILSL